MQNKSILDKPVGGTPADVADAIAKKHTQNTDTILDDGGANKIAVTELVRKATANITYYVATDGNDTTGDGTTGLPFATVQHAVDLLPKNLNGYQTIIKIKDGTYAQGPINIKSFFAGELYIYSDNWNADLVIFEVPSAQIEGFVVDFCDAYVYLAVMSVKIQKNDGICFNLTNSSSVEVYESKVGDNGNIRTRGVNSVGSIVHAQDLADIDANKVAIGLVALEGGIIIYDGNDFGDTLASATDGGLITDGIVLNKANYDSAVSLKHTQGTDTTLGTMTADIDMNNSYQVVNLQAPDANGQAIRATTKITEALLETIQDTYMNQPKTMARSLFR